MRKYLIFLNVTLLFLVGCSTASKLSIQNLSFLYSDSKSISNVPVVAWHNGDNQTIIYYKLNLHDFLYARPTPADKPESRFSVRYELYNSYESDAIIDSLTLFFYDTLYYGKEKQIIEQFTIPASYGNAYLLKLIINDLNRKQSTSMLVDVNKNSRFSAQNFLAMTNGNLPMFQKYVSGTQAVRIKINDVNAEKIFVRYYRREFPIATPPFVMEGQDPFDYTADSLFSIPLDGVETSDIYLTEQGFYHFQLDTNYRAGFTLFNFYEDFPDMTTADQILEPLRYLTTKKEYNNLAEATNVKLSVDSFWVDHSGNFERARSQISRYYNRVKDANILFSSYLEGWKSDRGIIYIIYGPPNIVYRTSELETWIYGEDGNLLSIKFNFAKVLNPFTDNDYLLTKSPTYKESWYNAVATWRR